MGLWLAIKDKDARKGFFLNKEWRRGFTLLEIMVALAIMSIALVTVMQLFSGSLRSAKVSYDYSLAVIGAKTKMEEALAAKNMEDFDDLAKSGEFDNDLLNGYHWEIIGPEPYEEMLPEGLRTDIDKEKGPVADLPYKLYQIDVKVKWNVGDKEKEVGFTTLKMLEERD